MSGTPVDYDPFAAAQGTPVEHDPFSSKKESVWEAVKEGAKQAFSPEALTQYAKEIPPDAAARMAAPVRLATGISRIPANLMSWAGVKEPLQGVKAAEEGAKKFVEDSGYTGMLPGAANLTGETILGGAALKGASKLAPVVEAIPGGQAFVKGLSESPSSQAILGGMGLGAAGSSGNTFDVLKEAGLGGALSLGGQSIASFLGHAAAPVLKRYNELKGLGYSDAEIMKDTTIGQFFGGKMQSIENLLANIPLSGVAQKMEAGAKSLGTALESKIKPILQREKTASGVLSDTTGHLKTAEQRALEDAKILAERDLATKHAAENAAIKATEADIHVPIINYALKPLGIEIKPGTTGNEAIKQGQEAISNAYNKALEGFSNIRLTKDVQGSLRALADDFGPGYLGKENAGLFKNDIDRLINDTTKGKWLTPENWQNQLSKLSKEAYNMRQKDPRYSEALYRLKDDWMDLVESQVGSDLFKAANTAFSKFKIPERAAAYSKSIKAGGEFSPNELINSLRSELSTKRIAGGEDEIQQLAVDAASKLSGAKESQKAKEALDKQNLVDLFSGKTRQLEDRFSSLQNSVAAQKAALKAQAEGQVGAQKQAIDAAMGPGKANDYAEKRMGYQLGVGSLGLGGGYGLTQLGLEPLTSALLGGGAIAGTRALYNPMAQEAIKRSALLERGPLTKMIGETLKSNAPLAGLTATQESQSMRGKPKSE